MEDLKSQLKIVEKSLLSVQEKIDELLNQQTDLEDNKSFLQAQIKSLEDQESDTIQNHSISSTKKNWESTTGFPWSERLITILKTRFKLDSFRPLQLSCINAILSKKDVMLIMPTGSGKSLCYQLPALLNKGFALVVSPLVSLMEDQLMSVKKYGIGSAMLNSSSSRQQVNTVHASMIDKSNDDLKLVYVTPEKIAKSKRFIAKLEKAYNLGRLSCVVIDEVHCASQWGHDFRPDYKVLGILKRQFPNTPVMGLTATATSKVFNDCKSILNLSSCLVFKASYNRQNLYYEVKEKPSSYKDQIASMENLINTRFRRQSGIIYCFSQKDTENVCHELRARNFKAGYYHANMSPKDRTKVHNDWCNNKIQVIVATVAFGMGIDKPDVKFVIHHTLSKSVENYYQESGRAGRDGLPATCIIYYKLTDVFRQSTMVCKDFTGSDNLYSMVKYCINEAICRRDIIAQHFGEIWKPSDCPKLCDVCTMNQGDEKEDVTLICKGFIEVIQNKDKPMTALMVIEAWKSSSIASSEVFSSKGSKPSVSKLERVLAYCLLEHILQESFHFTPYNTISYIVLGKKADNIRLDRLNVTMRVASKRRSSPANSALITTAQPSLSSLPAHNDDLENENWLSTRRLTSSTCSASPRSNTTNPNHHCTSSTPLNHTVTTPIANHITTNNDASSTPNRTIKSGLIPNIATPVNNTSAVDQNIRVPGACNNTTNDSTINTTTDYSISTVDTSNDTSITTTTNTTSTVDSKRKQLAVVVKAKKRSFIEESSSEESDDDFISFKTPSMKKSRSLPTTTTTNTSTGKRNISLKRRQRGAAGNKGKGKLKLNESTFPSLNFVTTTPAKNNSNDIIEISDSD